MSLQLLLDEDSQAKYLVNLLQAAGHDVMTVNAANLMNHYGSTLESPKSIRPEINDWVNDAILKGMALEMQERSPSIQAWISLLHPPEPASQNFSSHNPKQSSVSASTAASETQKKENFSTSDFKQNFRSPSPDYLQSSSRFRRSRPRLSSTIFSSPYIALLPLLLGYIYIGMALALSTLGKLLAAYFVLAWLSACLLALGWLLSRARFWVLLWTGIAVLVLAGVNLGGIAWFLFWSMALAILLAWIRSLDTELIVAFIILIGVSSGLTISYFMGAGILWGSIYSISSVIIAFLIVIGMNKSEEELEYLYNKFIVLLIFCLTSAFGLALGGWFGGWLKTIGVQLPT
ncbi:MAG: hypothetical protein VKJ24_10700 [Synechococcales bacterium]|nr:hypothetical protein [Synechococcales bacterium]